MSKKNTFLLMTLLLIIGMTAGGTFAYWTWYSPENKSVVFNVADNISEYVVYDEGSSHFVGNFMPTSTYCQAVNTTVSFRKEAEAANIALRATINMEVNAIGSNIAASNDVYWVITEGDSTVSCSSGLNSASVVNYGTFYQKTSGSLIELVRDVEVTTTEKKYTIWIWINSSGTNLDNLSGDTIDTNVWTRFDMVDASSDNNQYMLTLNGNGGTIDSATSITKTVTNGSTYGTLPIPKRTGYAFTGWNTMADGSGIEITESSMVSLSTNTTLYAMWGQMILFSLNNQHTEITGGWSGGVRDGRGTFSVKPYIFPYDATDTYYSIGDTMNISWPAYSSSYNTSAFYATNNQLDLSNINSITVNLTADGYIGSSGLCVLDGDLYTRPHTDSTEWANCAASVKIFDSDNVTSVTGTVTLDVSSITSGDYHIVIGGASMDYSTRKVGSLIITEISME